MDTVGAFLNPTLDFLKNGFNQVNAVQGLLIALFATVLMARWAQLFVIALGSSLVNIAVDTIAPIIAKHADVKLPPVMELSFWKNATSTYAGFVIVISMFFAVKAVVFRPSGHGRKAKA
jgi:hypothetical protein